MGQFPSGGIDEPRWAEWNGKLLGGIGDCRVERTVGEAAGWGVVRCEVGSLLGSQVIYSYFVKAC